ncbi:MAG: AmmeMemoRadiSam system protein B [Elusimicrobiota bacterium]
MMPQLRFVEVFPMKVEGEDAYCLRDPDGYMADPVYLTPHACFIALMLDGSNGPEQIRKAFSEQFKGEKVTDKDIEDVIAALDEQLLIDSPRFKTHRGRIDGAFYASRVRDEFFAGRGYPKDPVKLAQYLDGFYKHKNGPGSPGALRGKKAISCLISPHIDLGRGGWCYAHAYKELAQRPAPQRIIMLGVAHAGSPSPFVISRKGYKTPLGTLESDESSLCMLEETLGAGIFEGEIVHRTEHSLEFQTVWLAHVFSSVRLPKIIPVLCASFGSMDSSISPASMPGVEPTIKALAQLALREDTLILAGVDLSHVGPRFGDKEPLGAVMAQSTQHQDRVILDAIRNGDAEGFWRCIMADGNSRRVCGVSAIYTALRLIGKRAGSILTYGQALDPAGGIVSFTAAVFNGR